MKQWKLLFILCVWLGYQTSALAITEVSCQDEINPQAYKACVTEHQRMLSQQLVEHAFEKSLKKTRLKIIYPSAITLHQVFSDPKEQIYYTSQNVSPNYYQISFDSKPFCDGEAKCTLGYFFAASMTDDMPKNEHASTKLLRKTHTKIRLAKKISGFFEKQNEDTDNEFQTLSWRRNDVLYQLTLKKQPKEKFITLANHLITYGY